jgi:hypothetical protein
MVKEMLSAKMSAFSFFTYNPPFIFLKLNYVTYFTLLKFFLQNRKWIFYRNTSLSLNFVIQYVRKTCSCTKHGGVLVSTGVGRVKQASRDSISPLIRWKKTNANEEYALAA